MASRFLPLLIGLRYVRSREAGFFVSFSSWLSLAGVCVGVAALITILSVMNGFEGELRGRLLAMGAPVTLTAAPGTAAPTAAGWLPVVDRLRVAGLPVRGAAPFIDQQALLSNGAEMTGALVRGIDPAREATVSAAARTLIEGRLDLLQPGLDRIILGVALADQLGVQVGGTVTALVPGKVNGALELTPQLRSFTVAGVFEAGIADHDAGLAGQAYFRQVDGDPVAHPIFGKPRLQRQADRPGPDSSLIERAFWLVIWRACPPPARSHSSGNRASSAFRHTLGCASRRADPG